jgi:hypothetical protein
MIRISLITLFLFVKSFSLIGQSCQFVEKIRKRIEYNLDNKNNDSILFYINQIPKNEQICYQEYLVYKLHHLLNIKEADSLEILLSSLNNSVGKSSNKYIMLQQIYLKGRFHYFNSQNDSASLYFIKTIELAKQQKNTTIEVKALNSLSNVFSNIGQFENSIKYTKEAIRLTQISRDKSTEIFLLSNLMGYYGKYYLKTKNKIFMDSARIYTKSLILEAKKYNKKFELLKAYSNMGSVYFQDQKFQLAINYSDSAIILANPNKHFSQICNAYANKSNAYLELGVYNKAKTAADSALLYAKKLKNSNTISDMYFILYDCENASKNYASALDYYRMYNVLLDSINSEEQFLVVNELEQKYNKSENEKKINDLNNEKKISNLKVNILVITIILFLIIVAFIIFILRQKSLSIKQNLLETEQRLNRSRINPHFFFNSITTLQGIALKENDGKKIFSNLFVFSKLMRETLESSYADLVTIKKEIDFLNNYVELQKLNQRDKFLFAVELNDVDDEDILIPAMIIQPFIENAIEHGFSDMQTGGLITLTFNKLEDELLISILDNGKGLKKSNEISKKDHVSRAMQITKDRLFLLNKLYKTNARYTLNDADTIGSIVRIFLPLNLKNKATND